MEAHGRPPTGGRARVRRWSSFSRERNLSSGREADLPGDVLGRPVHQVHGGASLAGPLPRLARTSGARHGACGSDAADEALSASTVDRRAIRRLRSLGDAPHRAVRAGCLDRRWDAVRKLAPLLDVSGRDAGAPGRARHVGVRAAGRRRVRLANRPGRRSSPYGRRRRDVEPADGCASGAGSLGEARRGEVHPGRLSERVACRTSRAVARAHGHGWMGRALGQHALLHDQRTTRSPGGRAGALARRVVLRAESADTLSRPRRPEAGPPGLRLQHPLSGSQGAVPSVGQAEPCAAGTSPPVAPGVPDDRAGGHGGYAMHRGHAPVADVRDRRLRRHAQHGLRAERRAARRDHAARACARA